MSYTIKQISTLETHDLRNKVLRPNQPRATCFFENDDEPDTVHFGAVKFYDIVGIASLYKEAQPFTEDEGTVWRLRGMATDPAVRGQGIGKGLLEHCIEYVKSQNGTQIWCNARDNAKAFYEGFGFTTEGDQFEIQGIGPHYLMALNLK